MKLEDILDKLGLELGMKVIDTKPNPKIIRSKNYTYTLVKDRLDVVMFRNTDGWGFAPLYVLTKLGTRFKRIE